MIMNRKLMHHEGHEHCGACGGMMHAHEEHTPDETLALLRYMAGHNKHHAEELHALAHDLEGEARDIIHSAMADMESCNEKLAKALEIMTAKKEG